MDGLQPNKPAKRPKIVAQNDLDELRNPNESVLLVGQFVTYQYK